MLQNAYFLAKIGTDTAKNERNLAEILPIGVSIGVHRRSASSAARPAIELRASFRLLLHELAAVRDAGCRAGYLGGNEIED